jgi:hypothetical protein
MQKRFLALVCFIHEPRVIWIKEDLIKLHGATTLSINDTQHNGTQHNGFECDTQRRDAQNNVKLRVVIL